MNNGTQDTAPRAGRNGGASEGDALAQTKRELMQAELKLARARATMTTAEIDVRVLTARNRPAVPSLMPAPVHSTDPLAGAIPHCAVHPP